MYYLVGILGVLGTLFGTIISIRYLVIVTHRIDESIYKKLYTEIVNNSIFNFSEHHSSGNPGLEVCCISKLKGVFIYVESSERLLKAGYDSKDMLINITTLRWNSKTFKEIVNNVNDIRENCIYVDIVNDGWYSNIGKVDCNINDTIILPEYQDIENEIVNTLENNKKLGILLYGQPGCGKTTFARYIAMKYKLNIEILNINKETKDFSILKMFSQIKNNSIVLFEDFDSIFDKRECLINDASFTFNSILNGIDGIYNTFNNVIFVFTANDISKIDPAIKNRPSRCKIVKEFKRVSDNLSHSIINEWSADFPNLTTDQLITIKDYKNRGFSLEKCKELMSI